MRGDKKMKMIEMGKVKVKNNVNEMMEDLGLFENEEDMNDQ